MPALGRLPALLLLAVLAAAAAASDVETVRSRLVTFFLDNGDCTQMDPRFCASGGCQVACAPAKNYSSTLDPKNFTWADINYKDQTSADWQLSHHLLRTVALYRSYLCDACSDAHSQASRRDQANGALKAYIDLNPKPPQWWWLDIGVPGYLGACVTLADVAGNLDPKTRAGALSLMAKNPGTGDGQNLIWEQQALIFLSSLKQDGASMAKSFDTVWSAVHVAETGDGIQADQSFYQHGPLLQSGAYGSDYGMDLLTLRALADGTSFAATAAAASVIDDYILDGEALFMRWNGQRGAGSVMRWDVAAKGREISRAPVGLLPVNTGPIAAALRSAISSPRAKELQALADRMQGNGSHLVASRHFWRSDTAVHHREAFAASAHMCSARTYPTEFVNGENSRGWLMGAGVHYFYRDGAEYSGIFPVWDWLHLPGVTSRRNANYAHGNDKNHMNSSFVGGVSDGNYTLAALDYVETSCGDSISAKYPVLAKKAYFFLDGGVIAMGAGIKCQADGNIATTLNQVLKRGDVMAKLGTADWTTLGGGQYIYPAANTQLLHDGFLYAPMVPKSPSLDDSQKLNVSVGTQSGSWRLIDDTADNAPVQADVFSARLEHGIQPAGETYLYSVLADASAASVASLLSNWTEAVSVVAHSTDALALEVSSMGPYDHLLLAVVFGRNVSLASKHLPAVTVSQPGTYMVGQLRQSSSFVLAASDPTQQARSLAMQLRGVALSGGSANVTCAGASSATSVTFSLPGDLFAGSTVTGSCQ